MALQTKTRRSRKKPLITTAVILAVVLLGGYTAYAYSGHAWPFNSSNDSSQQTDKTSTPDTIAPDLESSDASKNSTKNADNSPPDKTPPQYSPPKGGDQTSPDDLTGVINYKSVQNGALVLRSTINQQVSSGTCDLTLTNTSSHKTVNRSAAIIARPSAATCDGFNVPLADLGDGSWDVTIHLTSGDKHGTLTGSVTIKT